MIYPSVGMLLCNHPDAEYQRACFDAYNLWIAEFCATAPERLIGLGQTALVTPEDGIRDLEAIKRLGLKGVMLPGVPPHEDYDHPMYDDLWDALVDLGLPPSFHILTSRSDTPGADHVRGPKLNSFMSIVRGNQDIIGTLIFGAVFERHPDLRVVCVEADAGWAPHWMYRADHGYDRHRNWLTAGELTRRPSEWFSANVYLTFQDDWVAFRTAHLMNTDRLMWANDFPHSDATWPNSQALLAEHAMSLDEHARAAGSCTTTSPSSTASPSSRQARSPGGSSAGRCWASDNSTKRMIRSRSDSRIKTNSKRVKGLPIVGSASRGNTRPIAAKGGSVSSAKAIATVAPAAGVRSVRTEQPPPPRSRISASNATQVLVSGSNTVQLRGT